MRYLALGVMQGMLLLAATCGGGDGAPATGEPTTATEPPASGTRVTFTSNLLGTSNRTKLSICVDGAGGLRVSGTHVEKVSEALAAAKENLDEYAWALEYLNDAEVVRGCPPAAVPIGELVRSRYEASLHAPFVTVPSVHRIFVYVLPLRAYAATFGEGPYFAAAAEMCCGGHNQASVTTSIYINPQTGRSSLADALLRALGLYDPCEGRDPCT